MPTGLRSMPILPARDVDRAVAFWVEKLTFSIGNVWRDDQDNSAVFGIVDLGTITIGLQKIEDWTAHQGTVAYLYVDDAKALAEQIKANGVALRHEPHETFYGVLEFDLVTEDGHVIAFGQDLNPGPAGPGL
ncbi:MAG: VOC family protein [Rhodospirillaceae bacterium]